MKSTLILAAVLLVAGCDAWFFRRIDITTEKNMAVAEAILAYAKKENIPAAMQQLFQLSAGNNQSASGAWPLSEAQWSVTPPWAFRWRRESSRGAWTSWSPSYGKTLAARWLHQIKNVQSRLSGESEHVAPPGGVPGRA